MAIETTLAPASARMAAVISELLDRTDMDSPHFQDSCADAIGYLWENEETVRKGLAEIEALRQSDRAWREIVIMLIKSMPPDKKQQLIAQLATIPAIAAKFTPEELETVKNYAAYTHPGLKRNKRP
jgi:hypothetical protein